MEYIDWAVLILTIAVISFYGIWKNRRSKNISEYLLANRSLPWYTVALSIIATQASAITFLSAPGQGYFDGVRFVQFYLGLPLAMWVIAKVFLPRFYSMNVITAYESIEKVFDYRVRIFTAILFLIQRGLAAGLVISAPSIILSEILGWNFYLTVLMMAGIVVIYTTVGGSAAISQTQFQQMIIILLGMLAAGVLIIWNLPQEVSLTDALSLAQAGSRLKVIDMSFDWKNKYNVWSGLIGGFFLALAYFGTDQSQVERYLSGKSIEESRKGLFFNALFKLPMQFFILLLGALLFSLYQFEKPPLFFKLNEIPSIIQQNPQTAARFSTLQHEFDSLHTQQRTLATAYLSARKQGKATSEMIVQWQEAQLATTQVRDSAQALIHKYNPKAEEKNYLFLQFVLTNFPHGIIGLLIAVIFFASMSTTASEINALASVSVVDIYARFIQKTGSDAHYVKVSRWLTVFWALFSVAIALFLNQSTTLIEAINQLGSLFYGVILGIFLLMFFAPKLHASAVFYGAIFAEIGVLMVHFSGKFSYLWYNVFGCLFVIVFAFLGDVICAAMHKKEG